MRITHKLAGKMFRNQKTAASVFALVCGSMTMLTTSARAGLITAGPYVAVGTAGNATATVIDASPTLMITSAGKSFTSIGPLDFQFPVTPTATTNTYFVTEGITNNTTQTWSDYHELLGTGTTGNFSLGGTPVQFLIPTDSTYSNTAFPGRSVSSDEIDYTGGSIAPGQAITITYSITVPDVSVAGPGTFTLRQLPTVVPEPGTLGLLAAGVVGLLGRRHRQS
jgi:PEP-CTERM motif